MKKVFILEIHKWVKCKGPKGEKMDVNRYRTFVFENQEQLDLFLNQIEIMNKSLDLGLFYASGPSIYMEDK